MPWPLGTIKEKKILKEKRNVCKLGWFKFFNVDFSVPNISGTRVLAGVGVGWLKFARG